MVRIDILSLSFSNSNFRISDTIVAIATALGEAGVAVIRVSGDRSLEIAQKISSRLIFEPRKLYLSMFMDPLSAEQLDQGCLVYFRGPESFTGEDVVEYHCHGSVLILNAMVSTIVALGARLADPGEFSKRAFLNGKMDLSQAESVIDLIHAKTGLGVQASLSKLQGSLYQKVQSIRHALMEILIHVEASIDFPEEVELMDKISFFNTINPAIDLVEKALSLQDFGRNIQHGIRTVIVGYPNVGKSSLLNRLLGEERALVSDEAGTTRDYIDVHLKLGDLNFQVIDTAGFRDAEHHIEKMGIEKIDKLIKDTDIVIWILDGTRPLNEKEKEWQLRLESGSFHKVAVLNKMDISSSTIDLPDWKIVPISALTGVGIDELKAHLIQLGMAGGTALSTEWVCNVRQLACLKLAKGHLKQLKDAVESGIDHAVLVIDLKALIEQFSEITGDAITEEVLDGIFSRFCVGK